MRKEYPEQFKVQGSEELPDGRYIVPHYRIKNYFFHIIFSTGEGWEHLSVTVVIPISGKRFKTAGRNPTWEEMSFLKDLFWAEDECVVQFHPPKADHISNHDTCLHLWKPTEAVMPQPPTILLGAKKMYVLEEELAKLLPDYSKEERFEVLFVYANKVKLEKFPETDEELKELASKVFADLQESKVEL